MPKWRSGSEFGPGPRVPLDRERRAVWRAKLRLARRPGRLTLACVVIGDLLVGMIGADGQLDPSIGTLAARAAVDPSTVTRALARLRQFGFLGWARRLVRSATTGWRVEQATNAYLLIVPATDMHFALAVKSLGFRKSCRQESGYVTIVEAARENAARQLRALGAPVPPDWGL